MSRQSVRAGICTYIGGPLVTGTPYYQGGPLAPYGLGTTFRSFPKEMPAQLWDPTGAGLRSGCVIVVHIGTQNEERAATAGPTSGWKRRRYDVTLNLFHRSRAAHAEAAQDDLDIVVDQLTALIQASRTLSGAVWQAGETGGIPIRFGVPASSNDSPNITETACTVAFQAVEYLQT